MIEIFEGRIGGGKTYSSVLRMLDFWDNSGTVATNVAIKWDEIKAHGEEFRGWKYDDRQKIVLDGDDQMRAFHRFLPRVSLAVLDEAHLWWNNRDWALTERELLGFLTQSRKYQVDVIFITQASANLDKQFARLVSLVWRFRDMENWRVPGVGVGMPPGFNKYILQTGFDYGELREPVVRKWVTKDPKIFKLYDTNAVYRTAYELAQIERGCAVRVPPKFGREQFKMAAAAAVGAVGGAALRFAGG